MSTRIRRNIEYYRLNADVEADYEGNDLYDRYRNANHIIEGYETRTYVDTPGSESMTIRQYQSNGGALIRTSVYNYNTNGTIATIVTTFQGEVTTETFTYDGQGRILTITANTV